VEEEEEEEDEHLEADILLEEKAITFPLFLEALLRLLW